MKKTQNSVIEISLRIKSIIENHMGFNCATNYETANFKDDLGMDSLDLVELTLLVEREFHIYIDDNSAYELKNVNDLVNFIKEFEKKKEKRKKSIN